MKVISLIGTEISRDSGDLEKGGVHVLIWLYLVKIMVILGRKKCFNEC